MSRCLALILPLSFGYWCIWVCFKERIAQARSLSLVVGRANYWLGKLAAVPVKLEMASVV